MLDPRVSLLNLGSCRRFAFLGLGQLALEAAMGILIARSHAGEQRLEKRLLLAELSACAVDIAFKGLERAVQLREAGLVRSQFGLSRMKCRLLCLDAPHLFIVRRLSELLLRRGLDQLVI